MRFWQDGREPGRRHRRPPGWVLATCVAAVAVVVAGLAWRAVASPGAPAADPRSAAGGPGTQVVSLPAPPVRVCGNRAILGNGPSSPPSGAVVIRAGDDSGTVLARNYSIKPDTTYWFAPGIHTLGKGQFAQIIPANGDTFIGAPGAVLDGRHQNNFAFTQSAHNVTISYLTIQNFGRRGGNQGEGVVNNDMGAGWHISHVTVQHNAGAGVMLGSDNVLSYSCLSDNGEYGLQGEGNNQDPVNITVDHDEIVGNNADNWEVRQPGCGCSGGAKFWRVNGATITSNYVHDNHGPGLWADTDNRGFDVAGNYIADNAGEGFIYEISYNLRLAGNTFVRNALVDGPHVGGFPDAAVYISESGADRRVPGPYGNTLAITGNTFTDNWSGVVLWENADRFCHSPANTSSSDCTLVAPKAATLKSCVAADISRKPYFGDCRWKTQNVLVSKNSFTFSPADIGPSCTAANFCGFNGIFSQFGTYPAWSPYHGTVVENNITFHQNNHFEANTYKGPWQFVIQSQGNAVSWSKWRSAPYGQDTGSTETGG
jgi:parallel beta helix pectate lyase-like protein